MRLCNCKCDCAVGWIGMIWRVVMALWCGMVSDYGVIGVVVCVGLAVWVWSVGLVYGGSVVWCGEIGLGSR